ncbi:MAG: ferritin family protein [Planctomycetota bacterium]|jgi:rubrerythrin
MLSKLTVRNAVEFAVRTEELGRMFYKKMAEKFGDKAELKEMFQLLAGDEALHEKQFRGLLEKLQEDPAETVNEEQFGYLRAMSLSRFFTGEEGLYASIGKINDMQGALFYALGMEKATVQYYEAMLDVLGGNEILLEIIQTEKEHVRRVMQYLMTDAKFRGISDDF